MNGGSLMAQKLKPEIRDRILENALAAFMENGYKNTSMKKIAVHSNIAVGNIYNYFKDKEELYEIIVQPVFSAINNLFEEPPVSFDLSGIEQKIIKFLAIYKSNKKIFMMLLENNSNTRFEKFTISIIDNFAAAIKRWINQMEIKVVRPDNNVFIKAFTTAYIRGIISILSEDIDEVNKLKELYDFLSFMKNGLYSKLNMQQEI